MTPPHPHGGESWRLRPRAADPASFSPRSVTRGESTRQAQKAKVDWLNCTFDASDEVTPEEFLKRLGQVMFGSISGRLDGGLFGFEHRVRLFARLDDGGALIEVGSFAYGGEDQRGRCLLSLNGKGCGLVADWEAMRYLLLVLAAEITRVDLAVDFLEGQYSVDDAVTLYHQGAFISRGRNPEFNCIGDWTQEGTKGRTVYIGKLKNGKTLCVYEKGRQLGDLDSEWTRFEVRLGNRDRHIPLEVLTAPDGFFTGAYPALREMLQAAANEIPTERTEGTTTVTHILHHLQRCYGKALHAAQAATGCSDTDLIEEMRVVGLPRRLDPASAAGIHWPDVQADLRRKQA